MSVTSTKVIVNADDFGLGPGIDEGIIQLAERRRISSTSIIACGEHFEAGIRGLLQRAPDLGTGVHLCLDEETPVLPADHVPTLVDSSGKFLPRKEIFRRLYLRTVCIGEVERELNAQVAKVRDSGIQITHIDGHGHIHVLPWIADILQSIARYFGIRRARMPLEPIRIRQRNCFRCTPIRLLLNHGTRLSSRRGFLATVHTPGSFFGLSTSGRLSRDDLSMFPVSRGRTTEIMVHPGLPTRLELDRYAHWNHSWQTEYETLLSDSVDNMLEKVQGRLVSFREVEE
jgi:predicted glycoside hydrolase/deacetylase ChbG (UPF0249 family)